MLADPIYLVLGVLVLGMNVIPAFMPPTWIILAFFYAHFHLALVPTVIIGATCATLGRIILATLSRYYLSPFLPKKISDNYAYLGDYLQQRQNLTIPIVLTYAFLPIPSNQVFIIAGLAKLSVTVIALSFLAGRLISYTFWISLAYHVSDKLEGVFAGHLFKGGTIITEAVGVLAILMVGQMNWKKILTGRKKAK